MKLYVSLAILLMLGCAHSDDIAVRPAPSCPEIDCLRTHENLDATLYLQTAAEYEASALQTFQMARILVEQGMNDASWTALDGSGEGMPAAVIVDVDDTVLDNSPYQARLILDDQEFAGESWRAWVEQAAAEPVPGADEFARWAESRNVTIFYVTNRTTEEEAATRRNLRSAGFPLRDDIDTVLTKNEREGWGSDKTPRRAHVARDFRVLLLIGDDLGDFVPRTWSGVESRRQLIEANRDRWGRQWLMVPNPTYGSWMSSLLTDRPESKKQRLDVLYEALEPKRD